MVQHSSEQVAVDIVVTTYNRLALTKETLESIMARTKYPHNLHVIDNASTDGTTEYLLELRKEGKIQRLVLNDYNTGMVMPKAQSVSLCSSPIFVITDCDVIPPAINEQTGRCWLEESLDRMKTDPKLLVMTLAIGKAKAKPWANANGINYCRVMGQTFQFFKQQAVEATRSPPMLSFERKCDDANKKPVFAAIDTRSCNLITMSGYRVGYTEDLWGDHIGSGVTKDGTSHWGYGAVENVPMERRAFNADEYKRHGYVECDSKTNKPFSLSIINRYHKINPLAVFAEPYNPAVLDGFIMKCEHFQGGATLLMWNCGCRERAMALDGTLEFSIEKEAIR